MLKSYQTWGIYSRTFMLNEHAIMLKNIEENKGQYSNYSQKQKDATIALTYIELLEKICLCIEDFCSLSYALDGELKNFASSIISQPNPQNILKEFTVEKCNKLFRYESLDSLSMLPDEKSLIQDIRKRNVDFMLNFVELLEDFLDIYWIVYTKHKHSNTMIYSFESFKLDDEKTFFIPAVYDRKKPENTKGILVNKTIYQKWKQLFNVLIILSKDMIDAAVEYIERNGKGFIVKTSYIDLTSNEINKIETICRKYNMDSIKVNLNVTINAKISKETIKKHKDLYDKFSKLK